MSRFVGTSFLNLGAESIGRLGDNLLKHTLLVAVEQPEEEDGGKGGEVEWEEEQPLEQEGPEGDDDAGGVDVEVGDEAQHRVGGGGEEEGEGEHQEERQHQQLQEQPDFLLHGDFALRIGRGGLFEESFVAWRLLGLASASWLLPLRGCRSSRGGVGGGHPSAAKSNSKQSPISAFL